jgi:hypothetical protein
MQDLKPFQQQQSQRSQHRSSPIPIPIGSRVGDSRVRVECPIADQAHERDSELRRLVQQLGIILSPDQLSNNDSKDPAHVKITVDELQARARMSDAMDA